MGRNNSVTFAEYYGISAKDYADVDVVAMLFPARITNRLLSNGIFTLEKLLNSTPAELSSFNGMGNLCIQQIDAFVRDLASDSYAALETTHAPKMTSDFCGKRDCVRQGGFSFDKIKDPKLMTAFLRGKRDCILQGDFSFIDSILDPELKELAEKYRSSYELLGSDIINEFVNASEKMLPAYLQLRDFANSNARLCEIHNLIFMLPHNRMNRLAVGFIHAYTQDEGLRQKLMSQYPDENATLQMICENDLSNNEVYIAVKKFLSWCAFDIQEDFIGAIRSVLKTDRIKTVISMRARHKTLEQTGAVYSVTRERIRQIEAKAFRAFSIYQNRVHLLDKISADRNGDSFITPADIEKYCGEYGTEMLYLLKNCKTNAFTYDSQLDAFIVAGTTLHERVFALVDELPDLFNVDKLPSILEEAEEETELPKQLIQKAIDDAYRITGDVYHRSRLSLASIYNTVLAKYYPEGIKAYDPEAISQFREKVLSEYGDVKLPANNRALTARISNICILCGRGVYKPKRKEYIPKSLATKIYDYIDSSDDSIFLMNTLFSVFEDDLLKYGVDNKYYLQGILHELFGNKLFFSRDYVSKDGESTSIYSLVVDFIRDSKTPVSKDEIQRKFPGISDIVINFSIADGNVLNYFGEYFHASHLRISLEDEQYLKQVIDSALSDDAIHHIKDIYEVVSVQKPEVFSRNYALYPFCAFSIIEYLFREQYQFSRPYIAKLGSEIGRVDERLRNLLYSKEEFTFSDIRDFCKENHYSIYSQLDYVNSCNDQYLVYDSNCVKSIRSLGITEEIAASVEAAIEKEVSETMPIRDLACWAEFPRICVPWTDWLVYSVLAKWGTRVEVAASNSQFRLAIPLVAEAGKMNTAPFTEAFKNNPHTHGGSNTIEVDDLNNIDDLLSSMLGEQILEEDAWD